MRLCPKLFALLANLGNPTALRIRFPRGSRIR
jgi:hypothetical protein